MKKVKSVTCQTSTKRLSEVPPQIVRDPYQSIRRRPNNLISIKWELKNGISLIRETTYRLRECWLPIRLFHGNITDEIIARSPSWFILCWWSVSQSFTRVLSTYFPSQIRGRSNSAFIFEILYVLNIKPESAMHKFLFSAVKSFLENPIWYVMLKLFKILNQSICSFYRNPQMNILISMTNFYPSLVRWEDI